MLNARIFRTMTDTTMKPPRATIHLPNLVRFALAVTLMTMFVGCGAGQYVKVRNNSNSDLTVRLYVGDRDDPRAEPGGRVPLYHTEKHLAFLRIGKSVNFKLRKNKFYKKEARDPVIRLWIESRAPVFADDPQQIRQHWIELVSFPPAVIDVQGVRNDLKFLATNGEVTLVPQSLWLDQPDPYKTTREANAQP